jgi:hypothetical protein
MENTKSAGSTVIGEITKVKTNMSEGRSTKRAKRVRRISR